MLFYNYINLYSALTLALDIANENRYHSYMSEQKKQLQQRPDRPAERPRNENTPMRVRSQTLLATANELIIEHEGREYRLRLTQNRKLILTA